jgi:glycosyltransferase involved in cell wall biosynthesis
MRIAVDVSIQDTPYLTGVEKTQRFILEELTRIDRDSEYLLISRRAVQLPFDLPDNFRIVNLEKQNPSYLWRERILPPLLAKEKVDLYYSPVSAISILGKAPKIATVHEIPWVERNRKAEPIRRGHRVWLFLNTRDAARIISVSERTRQNILSLYPEAADKVQVIHHGVDPRFQANYDGPSRAEFLSEFGIPDLPYFLFVGTLRRKKNLRSMLDGFAMLPPAVRDRAQVILAGVRNVTASDLDERVESLGLKGRVHFPGYVSDDDLEKLYHCAEALIYPSLFEGFGLPPLEAMACGTPVIASTGGAIPEVVGDAAFLVEPIEPKAFAEAMETVLQDSAVVEDLRFKGFQRVKKFTWRKTALSVLSMFESVTGSQFRTAL